MAEPTLFDDLMKIANTPASELHKSPNIGSRPKSDRIKLTLRFASVEQRRKAADAILTVGRITVSLNRKDLD